MGSSATRSGQGFAMGMGSPPSGTPPGSRVGSGSPTGKDTRSRAHQAVGARDRQQAERPAAAGRLGDPPELAWGHGRHGAGGDGRGGNAQNPEIYPFMAINTYKGQKKVYQILAWGGCSGGI